MKKAEVDPQFKNTRKVIIGAVAAACLSATTPALANTVPNRSTSTATRTKPVKTVKGAVARIGRQLREGSPLRIENRFDVLQPVANKDTQSSLASCVVRRAVMMSVSGRNNYFALEVKKPDARTISNKSVNVSPLGGADEVDRSRNPEQDIYVFDGTPTQTTAIIELNHGVLGTETTESFAAAASEDRPWSSKLQFLPIGQKICNND